MKKIYYFLLLIPSLAFAQEEIPTGTWRTHFNYTSAEKLAITENKIYCATKNGLFSLDPDDGSLRKLSKLDGLSDAGIGTMTYLKERKILVLGYKNGNIDIISEEGVANLDAFKKSNFESAGKLIHSFIANDDYLFCATGSGVIVIDLTNFRIKENYREIGPAGKPVAAYEVVFYNDSIFVASNHGILSAPFNEAVNLLDYNNWTAHNEENGLPADTVVGVLNHDQQLLAYTKHNIYRYSGTWSPYSFQPESAIRNINNSDNKLLISLEHEVVAISDEGIENYQQGLISPVFAASLNDQIWVADRDQGLMGFSSGTFTPYAPNGPFAPSQFNLFSRQNNMVVTGGGYDPQFQPFYSGNGFYEFEKGQWKNYNAEAKPPLKIPVAASDLVSGDFDITSQTTWLASFRNGVLQWQKDGTFEMIDENTPGSTLKRNAENDLLVPDVRIKDAQLWILNYGNDYALHRWDETGTWQSYEVGSAYPVQLLPSSFGDHWMILAVPRGGGIVVFNPEKNLYRKLSATRNNGGLPGNEVTAIAEDTNGEIWVGTTSGLAYFAQPWTALENEDGTFYAFDASFPIVDDGIFLRGEAINDIVIDPGNRKWIATNKGVWVVEGNGGRFLFAFNEENSPLPSNSVLKIEMNGETGEVFFITEKGMVSFRSDASTAKADLSNVKIFPNPVYPRNNALVTISGLVENTIVKVTSVSGNLIWETQSYGGTATWNAAASNIDTGVYLIFATDEDANEKFVGKIVVVK